MSEEYDPLPALRAYATMRKAALALRGIDNPSATIRMRMIRRPEIQQALFSLMEAASTLVGTPEEDVLFWHPQQESYEAAQDRFEAIRKQWRQP